jgi:glycosyltransferase involved in cell wall biosynthesis
MRCEAEKIKTCWQARPLVSVAVPCYNQEAVLPQTLNSLVEQDYDPLEIVVSDDASVDRTGEIAQDYARRFPGRVTYNRQPRNLGVTGNVRAMRPLLRGDLICWFAGDDLCLPGKITAQVAALAANPQAVACYHDVDVFDGATSQSLYRYNDERRGLKARAGHIARDLLIERCFIGAISIMVRRHVAEEVQHRAELPRVSDWLYLMEIAHRGEIIYIDKVLARYRRHKSNATSIIDFADEATTYNLVRELYPE